MKKFVFAFVSLALVAGACGGDDGGGSVSAADSPLVAALADDVMEESADSPIATREEAECFAGNMVGRVGEDRLFALGLTVEDVGDIEDFDFTEGEITSIVSSMTDCIDLKAAMAEAFEDDFEPDDAACLADELGTDLLTDMLELSLADPEAALGDDFFQAMLDAAGTCDLPLG